MMRKARAPSVGDGAARSLESPKGPRGSEFHSSSKQISAPIARALAPGGTWTYGGRVAHLALRLFVCAVCLSPVGFAGVWANSLN